MRIERQDLEAAEAAGIVTAEQARRLWEFWGSRTTQAPAFRAAHILYYLGGLVALTAISLFVTVAWDSWAGWPMLVLALGLAVLGVVFTQRFLARGLVIPAGLTLSFAVATTPLAVYSLQHLLGYWTGQPHVADFHRWIDWRWYFMEMATLVTALIALWRYRLPFTMLVVAVMLWYLSMDLVPLIDGGRGNWETYFDLRRLVSLYMGLGTMLLAFWVDVRSGRRKDYAFWLYLAGVAMFWGGLTAMDSHSEIGKFLYCLINLLMVALGAALMRRVFAVFGAIGIALYLGHLANLFAQSLLFPVALAAIGLAIIYAGIWWQKHEDSLHRAMLGVLPGPVRELIERAHG